LDYAMIISVNRSSRKKGQKIQDLQRIKRTEGVGTKRGQGGEKRGKWRTPVKIKLGGVVI